MENDPSEYLNRQLEEADTAAENLIQYSEESVLDDPLGEDSPASGSNGGLITIEMPSVVPKKEFPGTKPHSTTNYIKLNDKKPKKTYSAPSASVSSVESNIQFLRSHGIQMLPVDDSNIVASAMESGQTVVLTGEIQPTLLDIILKWIFFRGRQNGSKPYKRDGKFIGVQVQIPIKA
jgi:hypothetical protein